MTPRDPLKTQRNRRIAELTAQINQLKEEVLEITGYRNEHSLNATYGGKHADYIDIKHEVIDSPGQFIALYLRGFLNYLYELGPVARPGNTYFDAHAHIKHSKVVRTWFKLFLTRTYLRQFDALARKRPEVEDAEIWLGQKNASYGILVTPRFKNGAWENDKSEIRHFKPNYWTIGHILQTGFVIPDEKDCIEFSSVDQYLKFFRQTLVRNSGSEHEMAIAKRYCEFVSNSEHPLDVPLLIPELRYGGKSARHEHRLDFTIIDPFTLSKVGFELSPWSTHGRLEGTSGKTQKQINEEAQANFEKEMRKLKAYFRKQGIPIIVYTDSDLKDYDAIFDEMAAYLSTTRKAKQLEFHAMEDFLAFKPSR
ncbi:topoisomerase II [Pseudomonas edaphica]|uniref:Topoisomerase II n=1 Tax=Pseudomonas edaphica TaxID=2006980 RepID=A0A7Y8E168_9PSED|nr:MULTISPECIES: topoisomerase II [Pseudomonas]NWC48932.1 topoisomerase II [Pseudomonas sp. IPO3747]NWE06428.1 topoisomerase II [Pseudomonas edaphica]NWE83265.1 topoisomerase II [Pseudomonas edaphica]